MPLTNFGKLVVTERAALPRPIESTSRGTGGHNNLRRHSNDLLFRASSSDKHEMLLVYITIGDFHHLPLNPLEKVDGMYICKVHAHS